MGGSMGSAKVQLRLLGSFAVTRGSEDITAALSQPKRLALVAWLALTRPAGLHRRDTLCALLWPESSDEKARAALRQLLSVLRRELGDHAFVIEGDLVGVDRSVVSSDAAAVFDALEAADDATAVGLYAGELLPGLHLSESEIFGRWFEQVRGELHRGVTRAAWRLSERAEAEGKLHDARRWAERAVAIDADDEAGLRRLITLQAQQGDRAAALRTQEAFARRLKEDWGTDPESATLELVEQIRTGGLNGRREARAQPVEPAAGSRPSEIPAAPTPALASPHVLLPQARPDGGAWPLTPGPVGMAARSVRILAVLGSAKRAGSWTVPEEIRITVVVGEAILDFREATFTTGTVVIGASVWLGGLTLIVPPGTQVENECREILSSSEYPSRGGGGAGPNSLLVIVQGSLFLAELVIKAEQG